MKFEDEAFVDGLKFLVDKPVDWTSFDVVNKLRFAIRRRLNVKKIKVGHAGTLDPFATGLLILCCGKATKQLHSYQQLSKKYSARVKLGTSTPTLDTESEEEPMVPIPQITEALLNEKKEAFLGKIEQTPPIYSAIKIDGVAAYKRARKGQDVTMRAREVEIFNFEVTAFDQTYLDLSIECSSGTYIRTLAADFAKALGTKGYTTALRRDSIGEDSIEDAWELSDLVSQITGE